MSEDDGSGVRASRASYSWQRSRRDRHLPWRTTEHTTVAGDQGHWVRWVVALWVAPLVLMALVYLVGLPWTQIQNGGTATWNHAYWYWLVLNFFPSLNPFQWTGYAYLLLALWSAASVWTMFYVRNEYSGDYGARWNEREWGFGRLGSPWRKLAALAAAVAMLLGIAMVYPATIGSDKALGIGFAPSVRFAISDKHHAPSTLSDLLKGAHLGNGKPCQVVGGADVPSCLEIANLPREFARRNASADAAYAKLSIASAGASNTHVLKLSLTYLYVGSGLWSVVRDGKNGQPLDSIVTWDGRGKTQHCDFAGPYAINGAFGGKWGNNLVNQIAGKYPNLFFSMGDLWGYCQGNKPVVVIPATLQQQFYNRTKPNDAGVITVTGDHGHALISHIANVRAGQLPGPAYPLSLAHIMNSHTDNMVSWAVGRKYRSRDQFGWEPGNSETQRGNNAEYLLKLRSGGLYWVTPEKQRGADTQNLDAWSFTPAGYAHSGHLNTTTVYVLGLNDPRVVNLYDLKYQATQSINAVNPGFFTSGGLIVEILPVNIVTDWQVYGEANQRVRYVLDCNPQKKSQPCHVTDLFASLGSIHLPPGTGDVCGLPRARQTNAEVAYCLGQYSKESQLRLQGAGK